MTVEIVVPVRTVSELNARSSWFQKHRRVKQQKDLTTLLLRSGVNRAKLRPPYRVRMTRLAPGAIRDSDNLYSATKAIRDAIAAFLEVDDADLVGTPEVSWSVDQERQSSYGVRIRIDADPCQPAEASVG